MMLMMIKKMTMMMTVMPVMVMVMILVVNGNCYNEYDDHVNYNVFDDNDDKDDEDDIDEGERHLDTNRIQNWPVTKRDYILFFISVYYSERKLFLFTTTVNMLITCFLICFLKITLIGLVRFACLSYWNLYISFAFTILVLSSIFIHHKHI